MEQAMKSVKMETKADPSSLTFPMRPEYLSKNSDNEHLRPKVKRKILVRKKQKQHTKEDLQEKSSKFNSNNQTSSSPRACIDSNKRKGILVARTVDPSRISKDALGTNSIASLSSTKDDDVYSSPFGPVSPVKTKKVQGHEENPEQGISHGPRFNNEGKPISYSILGNVEEYMQMCRHNGTSPTPIAKDSDQSVGRRSSSRMSFQQVMRLKNSFSSSKGSKRMSSLSPTPALTENSTPNASTSSVSDNSSGDEFEGTSLESIEKELTKEEYLEKVRQVAKENTLEQHLKAEENRQRELEAKHKSLPIHLQQSYSRQERALKRWEEWQKEWNLFKASMCKSMNKTPSELILSRASEYRQKIEEYKKIATATPHHQKHGSDYWMMSLRGLGTRYVAVGNIFSGLFCPVKENPIPDLEIIRASPFYDSDLNQYGKISSKEGRIIDLNEQKRKKTWRDAPELQRRKRQLRQHLSKLKTKSISDEDLSFLGIRGESLFEWAYVSTEKRAYELEQRKQLENDEGSKPVSLDKSCSKSSIESPRCTSTRSGPRLEMKCNSCWSQQSSDSRTVRLVLQCNIKKNAIDFVDVSNTGSTSMYYSWNRTDGSESRRQNNHFFVDSISGVILPGDTQRFSFAFKSVEPGCWSQTWTMSTVPSENSKPNLKVVTKGLAIKEDQKGPKRAQLKESLEGISVRNELRDTITEIVRDLKTPEKPLTEEEKIELDKNRFWQANRPLGLFYHRNMSSRLNEVAYKVFQLLHSGHVLSDEEKRYSIIEDDFKHWIEYPSLITLQWFIRTISQGKPLYPPSLAETQSPEEGENSITKDSVLSPSLTSISINGDSNDNEEDKTMRMHEDTILKRYKEVKITELRNQAKELENELLQIAQEATKRPLQNTPKYVLARNCVIGIADIVAEERQAISSLNGQNQEVDEDAEEGNDAPSKDNILGLLDDLDHKITSEEIAARSQALKKLKIVPSSQNLAWLTEAPSENLKGKRVLLRANLNISPSRDDPGLLDEVETERKLKRVVETIDILSNALVSSIVIIATRGSENTGANLSLESVADELATRLGRGVTFFDDCIGEEAMASLISDEGEDESEQDSNEIDSGDDVPVYLLENLLLVPKESTCEPDGEENFVKVLECYGDIYVEDALADLLNDTPSSSIGENLEKTRLFGPNFQADMISIDQIFNAKHAVFFGGDDPKNYPNELSEDDERNPAAEGKSSNFSSSERSSSKCDAENKVGLPEVEESKDDISKIESSYEKDGNSLILTNTEDRPENILKTELGFASQIRQLNAMLDLNLASEIFLVGPIGKRMYEAVVAMGEVAKRLFSGFEDDSLAVNLSVSPDSVQSKFGISTYKEKEEEMLRQTLEKARHLGIPIYVPPQLKANSDSTMGDMDSQGMDIARETRKHWKKIISARPSVLFLANANMHTNSDLLRHCSKLAKTRNTHVWTAHNGISNSLEYLILSSEDLEQDSESETESENEKNEDSNSVNQNSPTETDISSEENVEAKQKYGFELIQVLRDERSLQHALEGRSFESFERVSTAEANKVAQLNLSAAVSDEVDH